MTFRLDVSSGRQDGFEPLGIWPVCRLPEAGNEEVEMKVMMAVEGDDCALLIEPEDAEGRALLAALGVRGDFRKTLASSKGTAEVTATPVAAVCAELAPEIG